MARQEDGDRRAPCIPGTGKHHPHACVCLSVWQLQRWGAPGQAVAVGVCATHAARWLLFEEPQPGRGFRGPKSQRKRVPTARSRRWQSRQPPTAWRDAGGVSGHTSSLHSHTGGFLLRQTRRVCSIPVPGAIPHSSLAAPVAASPSPWWGRGCPGLFPTCSTGHWGSFPALPADTGITPLGRALPLPYWGLQCGRAEGAGLSLQIQLVGAPLVGAGRCTPGCSPSPWLLLAASGIPGGPGCRAARGLWGHMQGAACVGLRRAPSQGRGPGWLPLQRLWGAVGLRGSAGPAVGFPRLLHTEPWGRWLWERAAKRPRCSSSSHYSERNPPAVGPQVWAVAG